MTTKRKTVREPLPENMAAVALKELRAIRRGELVPKTHTFYVPPPVDVAQVRAAVGLSQIEFAAKYGFSLAAVRKWEQGTREPDAAARTLIGTIGVNAKAVDRLISQVPASR